MEYKIFEEIKNDPQKSFLKIPSSMPRTFNRNDIKNFFIKDAAKKLDDIGDKSESYDSDIMKDILSKNSSESETKKKELLGNSQVSIDLNNGLFFEQFFINRIDRDIFDLKYHSQISTPDEVDYSDLNPHINDLSNKEFLDDYKIFLDDIYSVLQGNDLFQNLKCKPDFIIKNVKTKDIKGILNDPNKKYHVFGSENLFVKETYDLFGEITIDIFKPEIYVEKVKQLLKYIIVIKLIEAHKDYFKDSVNKALVIGTNGKYLDFVNKLSAAKIYTKEDISDEFDFSTFSKISNNSKKYAQEITNYKKEIFNFNNKFGISKTNVAKNNSNLKDESKKLIEDYEKLKEHTLNFLKILKNSNIPFILIYFPKIGDELPFELFKNSQLSISKIKGKEFEAKYSFNSTIDEKIKKLEKENNDLKNSMAKLRIEKDLENKSLNFKVSILFSFIIIFLFGFILNYLYKK